MIEISVIVPIKDEDENILLLADEIEQALSSLGKKWECIWVDDGSTDNSFEKLKILRDKENSVHRIFQHEKCFGQSAAMATGFALARGRILVTLDGDGQNDPSSIPDLVKT